jgi:hypothetical protein
MARTTEAKTLRIEGKEIVHPKLEKFLQKHYNAEVNEYLWYGIIEVKDFHFIIPLK